MSATSQEMLKTPDKRVHEQLDMLVAAMHTQSLLQSDIFYEQVEGKSPKETNSWIKKMTVNRMNEMGYSQGFTQKRLLIYVFQLYEQFYVQYQRKLPQQLLQIKEGTTLQEVQHSILLLAAAFLEEQFGSERRADICTFLMQDC